MANHDVISMPDTWEYPWYAAWDLAFHTVPLMMVDPDFAKDQLSLMLSPRYLHPSGQIPAYEWNFGDVNPPVHAFATLLVHTRWKPTSPMATPKSTSTFLTESFAKPAPQLHVVGQPQGPWAARTCSRAGSSDSTTSACSTAVRRFRPAAGSSRPTARRGWRCSARTCWSWR